MSSQLSSEPLTVVEYLRGVTAYDVPDSALRVILVKRELGADETVESIPVVSSPDGVSSGRKSLDLATADLYMWCASTPSVKNDTEDSDAGWKHKEGGWQTSAFDKRQLRQMAKDLYDKWGESANVCSKMRILNF